MSKKNPQQDQSNVEVASTYGNFDHRDDEAQLEKQFGALKAMRIKEAELAWKRQQPMWVIIMLLMGLILVGLVLLILSVRQVSSDLRVFIYGTQTPQVLAAVESSPTSTSAAAAENLQPTPFPPTETPTPEPKIEVEWPVPADKYYVGRPASLEVIVQQGEQGKAGKEISVTVDNSAGLELEDENFSTDENGKAILSFIPRQTGDFTITAVVDDQSQEISVHAEILDSDEDGIGDDQEQLWGSDPAESNLYVVTADAGLQIRRFSSPDIQLATLPLNTEVFFIPGKKSSNSLYTWSLIKLSYPPDAMDPENRLAKGTELSLLSQEDQKIKLSTEIACKPAESSDVSPLDLMDISQLGTFDCLVMQPENDKYVIWLIGAVSDQYLKPVNPVLATEVPAMTLNPPMTVPVIPSTPSPVMDSTTEAPNGGIAPTP